MAKDDFTVEIEDGRIMFMTSYRDEFGEERKVANIISKERLIEIRDNINRALAKLSNENGALPIPVVRRSFKFDFKFGHLSKEGYRHFPIIYFAYGTNGFSLCLLGATITVKLW